MPNAELPAFADTLVAWLPYLHSVVEASTRLHGGEVIPIGKRQWEVLHTPGHSLGHVCLWSPADKLLFSGDHLLPAVTPRSHSSVDSTRIRSAVIAHPSSWSPSATLRW